MNSSRTSSVTTASPVDPGRGAEGSTGEGGPEAGGTLISVVMPKMGISVSEGTVVEWRKKPGDWVDGEETICDVTTDKIDVEIPAPAAGRVQEILVEEGSTVDCGVPIARIDAGATAGIDPGLSLIHI